MRQRRKLIGELHALRQELDVLRAENARLRLERETPASIGAASERAHALLAAPRPDPERDADSAATMLAEAVLVRSSVITVVEELQITFARLLQQLRSGAPAVELDRRVRDRRAGDVDRRDQAPPAHRLERLRTERDELTSAGPGAPAPDGTPSAPLPGHGSELSNHG